MSRMGFALSAVMFTLCLQAQEIPEPKACRPLFTTSAAPAELGVLELEFGGQRILNQDHSSDNLFPIQFNLGLNSWLDVRVGWGGPLLRMDSQGQSVRGGTDPVIGAQAIFIRQNQMGFDLGVAYWHKHPRASVSKGIGTGRHDDTLLLAFSRMSGRWLLDVNAGANFLGRPEGEGRVKQGVVSAALTCALGSGWNLTLDTYALQATELGDRAVSSILAVSRDVSDDLCIDAGVEVGHNSGAPRFSFNAGLVWRLGRLWGGK